jgi:ABC-type Fe3+ transport system substrate-binding protein
MKHFAFVLLSLSNLLAASCAVFAADAALVEAAKKEGRVTWYTVQIADQIVRPVISGFEQKYGIHVDFVRSNSATLAARLLNEGKAGQVKASVFDGTSATVALERANLVEKWVPDADLPKNLFDPDGYWVACNYYINTPGFNTNLVPKGTEPKTFEDLLDPKWKGRMAWNVQPSVSAGQGLVGSILIAWGEEKARAYLAKLAKQDITPLLVSGRQVLDLVITGEYPIGLQIFNNHAYISASKGAPVDWIKMQPPLITFAVMSVPKGAPSPNAGKLLIDYIVSPEGQRIIADAGELPVHPGVKPRDPTLIPDGVTFKGSFLTPEELDKELVTWTKIFDEYFR